MPGIKRDILERPFDSAQIKTRKGPHGSINYVEGAEIIKRLNESFEAAWDFTIVEREVRDTEVVVLVKLVASGVTKMAFGGSTITVTRDTGAVVNVADDLKAAATDGLKKCATLFGIGLHLYGEGQPHVTTPARTTPPTNGRNGNGGTAPANGNGNRHGGSKPTNGNGLAADRLSQRQLSCIWGIARRLGLTTEDVRERTTATFGVLPEYLSRKDGSAFIAELQTESEPAGVSQ